MSVPAPRWQTTVSEHGGMVCVSVPQISRENAGLEAERVARDGAWDGRLLAPDARVLAELWDDAAGRVLQAWLYRVDAHGNLHVEPVHEPAGRKPKTPGKPKRGRRAKARKGARR